MCARWDRLDREYYVLLVGSVVYIVRVCVESRVGDIVCGVIPTKLKVQRFTSWDEDLLLDIEQEDPQ